METIKFSYNWNDKLTNKAFTTIRLHNPHKYRKNGRYRIECIGQLKGIAELKDIRTFTLASLNDFIAYLDTGYNVSETKAILQQMYKNKVVNWDTQQLDFCLLVYEKQDNAIPPYGSGKINMLFEVEPITQTNETCRNCKHRFSTPLNEYSRKALQCCKYKKGKNNAGYKTIKVTDKACRLFDKI